MSPCCCDPSISDDLLVRAGAAQARALEIVGKLEVGSAFASIGAEAHLVGSLRMGLLMKHRDIDFHVYSQRPFSVGESFSAVARLAENGRVRQLSYANLLETDEKCLEWHLSYEAAAEEIWQIDIIHILRESPWAFYFESAADRIKAALTPETRRAILAIKDGLPEGDKVPGIEIYQAVLRDGVRDLGAFQTWRQSRPAVEGIIGWMPG